MYHHAQLSPLYCNECGKETKKSEKDNINLF